MADGGTWAVMTIFALVVILTFAFILFIGRKFNGPEYSEWKKENEEWEKANPIWNFVSILPFPIGTILGFIGPKRPPLRKNNETGPDLVVELPNPDANNGYSPQFSMKEEELGEGGSKGEFMSAPYNEWKWLILGFLTIMGCLEIIGWIRNGDSVTYFVITGFYERLFN